MNQQPKCQFGLGLLDARARTVVSELGLSQVLQFDVSLNCVLWRSLLLVLPLMQMKGVGSLVEGTAEGLRKKGEGTVRVVKMVQVDELGVADRYVRIREAVVCFWLN